MSFPILTAQARTSIGRKNYAIRNEGLIPAIVYGAGHEPQNVQLDRNEFVRLYRTAGESTIVELQVDGKSVNVLMYDYQLDPLRDEVIHADFRIVDMNKELDTMVKLVFVGEAPAVKALGGTLVNPIDEVHIRALPGNLPNHIDVDLSTLVTFEDSIRIENLNVPEGVKILDDARATVAVVAPPRSDAEMADLDKAVEEDVASVKVEGEEKKAEGEEGAAEEKKEA